MSSCQRSGDSMYASRSSSRLRWSSTPKPRMRDPTKATGSMALSWTTNPVSRAGCRTVAEGRSRSRLSWIVVLLGEFGGRWRAGLSGDFGAGETGAGEATIEGVALDMGDPFLSSTREHVPGAEEKLVFDRFHLMKHANVGVDTVRKGENRALWKEGDPTLKGSQYLWLCRGENLPERDQGRFTALQAPHLKTGRACALKEALAEFWEYQSPGGVRNYRRRWYFWATHSHLEPMKRVAAMITDHLTGVMSFFMPRVTNATAEGLNSKIATIQTMPYGFRNKSHWRTAVLFRCGGRDLYPETYPIAG